MTVLWQRYATIWKHEKQRLVMRGAGYGWVLRCIVERLRTRAEEIIPIKY